MYSSRFLFLEFSTVNALPALYGKPRRVIVFSVLPLSVAIDEFFKLPYARKRIRAALGDTVSPDTGGKTRRIGNVAAVLQVARRKRGGKCVSGAGRIGFMYIECRDHFPVQPVVDKKTAFSEPYDHIFVVNER